MKRIYFDTEFTFLEFTLDHAPKLISAGFVAEDGQEFYVELIDHYQLNECSHFVRQAVVPHLNGTRFGKKENEAALVLKDWIEMFEAPVQLASDNPNYDWPLVKDLLLAHACWPKNLDGKAHHAGNYLIQERIERYFEYQPMAIRHHALWDARALFQACSGQIDD